MSYELKNIMRLPFAILIILLTTLNLFGQTYTGDAIDKSQLYNFLLRINKDSTINFIYNKDENGVYAEYMGNIKRGNDSLYHISATMLIGQHYMKSPCMYYYEGSSKADSIYIQIDSTIARELDVIEIAYSNNTYQQFQGYDEKGNLIKYLKIPIDHRKFNNKNGTNFIKININKKNLVTGKWLSFKIKYGSGASFRKGEQLDFDIVIKKESVYSVGTPILYIGHFKLKKEK